MTTQDRLAAALRRLQTEARSLSAYQTAFVTQADIHRVSIDGDRLLSVLAITDATRIEDINDMVELRERLNIVRADLEDMDKTLIDAENLVDNPDEVL
jgi:hypothetical protein